VAATVVAWYFLVWHMCGRLWQLLLLHQTLLLQQCSFHHMYRMMLVALYCICKA